MTLYKMTLRQKFWLRSHILGPFFINCQ